LGSKKIRPKAGAGTSRSSSSGGRKVNQNTHLEEVEGQNRPSKKKESGRTESPSDLLRMPPAVANLWPKSLNAQRFGRTKVGGNRVTPE